jgi:pimeloyl-ACP methyl ester carboxylesterase
MSMKYLRWIGVFLLLVLLLVLVGPRPSTLLIDVTPMAVDTSVSLFSLAQNVKSTEASVKDLRVGNEAQIIWADSVPSKTPYSFIYLHGFSASHAEAFPIHQHIARRYGCNLYLSRLYAHGLAEQEPLLSLTPEKLIQSAKEAIAIGKQIGDKVILMSTSTGGTLSLLLAGKDSLVAGLILYSPNIDLHDEKSFLLTQPWGLQLARLVIGDRYYRFDAPQAAQQFWNTKYRIEALIALKSMMNATMHSTTFKKIHQPVFMGYYYKDEQHQDDVVSIPRMLEMYSELGTVDSLKRRVAFPNAGYHVIGSSYWSPNTAEVEYQTDQFLEEIMQLKPKTR